MGWAFKLTTLIEFVAIIVVVWFVISQIVIPLVERRPFFPILRHEIREADQELAEAMEDSRVRGVLREAETIREADKPAKPKPKRRTA